MKHFVITIMDNKRSVQSADRCIVSGGRYGKKIEKWPAITPNDNINKILQEEGIDKAGFIEKYSRPMNCIAAFLSHYSLWQKAVELNEDIVIFEHDAYVLMPIPDNIPFYDIINIGQPSYGKFNTPSDIGVNSLTSKRYLPGAHAYIVSPQGAQKLIKQAKIAAGPTDVFIHLDTFPSIQEYYPWLAQARDTFSTIQKIEGCKAKHNFGDNYEII